MNPELLPLQGLSRSQNRAPAAWLSKAVRVLSIALLRLLGLLVILLLALPVAILPIGSGVPAPVWMFLALGIVALVILLFHSRWTLRAVGISLLGMVLGILAATVASQIFAATLAALRRNGPPPYTGDGLLGKKELIWLEGGHGLSDANLPQFTDVMIHTVLAQTQNAH